MTIFTGKTTINVVGPEDAPYDEIAAQLQDFLGSTRAEFGQLKDITVEYIGRGRLTVTMKLETDPYAELDDVADEIMTRGFRRFLEQPKPEVLRVVESSLTPA